MIKPQKIAKILDSISNCSIMGNNKDSTLNPKNLYELTR